MHKKGPGVCRALEKLMPLALAGPVHVAFDLVVLVLGQAGPAAVRLKLVALLVVGAVMRVAVMRPVSLDLVARLVVGAVMRIAIMGVALVRHCSSLEVCGACCGAVTSLDVPAATNLPTDPSNSQPGLRSCVAWADSGHRCGHS